jgi:hypothetical protein
MRLSAVAQIPVLTAWPAARMPISNVGRADTSGFEFALTRLIRPGAPGWDGGVVQPAPEGWRGVDRAAEISLRLSDGTIVSSDKPHDESAPTAPTSRAPGSPAARSSASTTPSSPIARSPSIAPSSPAARSASTAPSSPAARSASTAPSSSAARSPSTARRLVRWRYGQPSTALASGQRRHGGIDWRNPLPGVAVPYADEPGETDDTLVVFLVLCPWP